MLASLVLCAATVAWGGVAEAMAPLPKTSIDVKTREVKGRVTLVSVLPEWAGFDLAAPLTVNEHGLGYFARSIRELKDTFANATSERKGHAYAYAYGHSKEKKPKRVKDRSTDPGLPGDEGATPGRPGDISRPGRPGNGFGDAPILPDPVDQPFVRTGSQGGPPPGGEVPEPPASMLLGMALTGMLMSTRPGKRR
jgi:hypothetical protein